MATMCFQCAMKAIIEHRAVVRYDEEPEEHRKRVHPDQIATDRERKLLEHLLIERIRNGDI
jgi:hypothetical protein